MAVVTLYGRAATQTHGESRALTFVNDSFVSTAFKLLPKGLLWPRETDTELYAIVRALSHTYARVQRRADELVREMDPRLATEILDEWESCLGLDSSELPDHTLLVQNWDSAGLLAVFNGIAYGNGVWVAVGDGAVTYWSTDGLNWNEESLGGANLYSVAYGGGYFVAVGDGGLVIRSPDGTNWDDVSTGGGNLHEIAYGGGMWVAGAGNGDVLYGASSDGSTWATQTVSVDPIQGVAYAGGTWIAVDAGGSIWRASADDLTTWVESDDVGLNFQAVCGDGDGSWVGVGDSGGAYYSSDDGLTWNNTTIDSPDLYSVISLGAGLFVVTGDSDLVAWSSDGGASWTVDGVGGSSSIINGIAWDGATSVVAVGDNGGTYLGEVEIGSINDVRRERIVGLLRGRISPTEANIIALAATLGYVITITTYSEDIFTCVSECTAPLYTAAVWLFAWTVNGTSAELDDELEVLLAAITPLHTVRYMNLT